MRTMGRGAALVSCLSFCVISVLLLNLIQPSEGHGAAAPSSGSDEHECLRECEWPPAPKHCRYNFTVEWNYVLSKACYDCPYNRTHCSRPHCIPLNGVRRPIITVNRMFPGPAIEVCKGDTIEVKVYNHMVNGEGVSIHWHGFPQKNTPYMDGVAMVTQCPIPESASFTYEMVADHPGTHWWHSHSGMLRADGMFGALIVRKPAQDDQHSALFDYDLSENVMLVQDWLHSTTLDKFTANHFSDGSNKADSVLINGKGRFQPFPNTVDPATPLYTDREIFTVKPDHRYRFRVISSAITNAPLKVSVDSHNLAVIASDGDDFQPVVVDAFIIYAGERFDFILNANQALGSYCLRVQGLDGAEDSNECAEIRYERASAHVVDTTHTETDDRGGIILQDLNGPSISEMISIVNDTIPQENMVTHYVAFDFYKVNNHHYHDPMLYPIEDVALQTSSPQLNHVSFTLPSAPPLSQLAYIPAEELCESSDVLNMTERCTEEFCECIHVISVQLDQTVELVLVDEGSGVRHPFHLHGHSFHVVGQDVFNASRISLEEVMELDKAGEIPRNLDLAPIKDTVIVPSGGYTIIQFVADNPGWWFFHCHIEFHVATGMGLLVHVGTDNDLPKPPDNFPRCGTFPPEPSFSTQPTASPTVCVLVFMIWLRELLFR
ncbi:uncharacterized protein [Diadema setosum]|uniref:uncharacterized protein n=1 Tax=Diadema setosum TaxID=31175 RepID=UPI003B3BBA0F